MALFPKINVEKITADLNARFEQLIAKLDEILLELKKETK